MAPGVSKREVVRLARCSLLEVGGRRRQKVVTAGQLEPGQSTHRKLTRPLLQA